MEVVLDKGWDRKTEPPFSFHEENKLKETMSLKAETDGSNVDDGGGSQDQQQAVGEADEKTGKRSVPLSQEAREVENLGNKLRRRKKARTERVDVTEERTPMYNRPYKRWPATGSATERGWLEISFRMGVTRPVFCLTKITTKSDTDPNQHRFQLTTADITNAMHPLKVLAKSAEKSPVTVRVLDRKGYTYGMEFKYLATSHTFRFMGAGYTRFLANTELKANQIMDIWGLPREGEGDQEQWLALLNCDGRIAGFDG